MRLEGIEHNNWVVKGSLLLDTLDRFYMIWTFIFSQAFTRIATTLFVARMESKAMSIEKLVKNHFISPR
jgi:hypothetical protein